MPRWLARALARIHAMTGEWMYVFIPSLEGLPLHVKLILRAECVVVSFHEDGGETSDA